MDTLKNLSFKTHLNFMNMDSVNASLYQTLVVVGNSLWVSVSSLFLIMFGVFERLFFRVHAIENSLEFNQMKSKSEIALPKFNSGEGADIKNLKTQFESEIEKLKPDFIEVEEEPPMFVFKFKVHAGENFQDFSQMKPDSKFEHLKYELGEGRNIKIVNTERSEIEKLKPDPIKVEEETEDIEEESPKFAFKFKFPSLEESVDINSKLNFEYVPSSSTSSKYEFKYGSFISKFIEKPVETSFSVEELYVDSKIEFSSNQDIVDKKVSPEKDFEKKNSEEKNVREPEPEREPEKLKEQNLSEEFEQKLHEQNNNKPSDGGYPEDVEVLSEKELGGSNSGYDSESDISNGSSFIDHFIGSIEDGIFSDFDEEFEVDMAGDNVNSTKEEVNLEESQGAENQDDGEDSDMTEELQKLEESKAENSSNIQIPENDNLDGPDKPNPGNSSGPSDSDDSNGLETLWEHQELIDQLKMELKKMKATGLPTILEESESPKMDDLKPWKIDEKFQHEDKMGELHKFYKSYRERMRKFDILNYQKMYTIGFLQSKDPLKSISSSKPSLSATALASLFSQNSSLYKRKKSESDPMKTFISELHGDLEVVYVGQLCLSWEVLHWQYEKSLELWESDPYGIHRYNEVAGEFQQFQVLMQRFIENEPFEGPRVQNYVKNRCVLRNLLQVPVIREDSTKDKKKVRMKARDEYAITSDVLVEIMEESIRIFWRFVRADKDANFSSYKGRKRTQIEPQDATDLELLAEVRASLQKKEKKLKDIMRGGNCILRKFQKHEDGSDPVLYFFSQVDMKLIARVLNMSKLTTDQLLWCRCKLSKINFISRKIQVEPSFLLFPC